MRSLQWHISDILMLLTSRIKSKLWFILIITIQSGMLNLCSTSNHTFLYPPITIIRRRIGEQHPKKKPSLGSSKDGCLEPGMIKVFDVIVEDSSKGFLGHSTMLKESLTRKLWEFSERWNKGTSWWGFRKEPQFRECIMAACLAGRRRGEAGSGGGSPTHQQFNHRETTQNLMCKLKNCLLLPQSWLQEQNGVPEKKPHFWGVGKHPNSLLQTQAPVGSSDKLNPMLWGETTNIVYRKRTEVCFLRENG